MERNNQPPDASGLRERAEKELETKAGDRHEISAMSTEEMAGLIHELQVHQVELKMQNEELRRIYGELQIARDRYVHLYDFSPVGYFSTSLKGIIQEANLTLADMLGLERGHLSGRPLSRFIFKDDQDIFYQHRRTLLATEEPQSCEVRLLKRGGTEFHAQLECLVVTTSEEDDSRLILGAVIDITDRWRAEQDKAILQEQLRQSLKMEAIGTLAGGIAHDFNNILSAVLGYTELSLEEVEPNTTLHSNLEHALVAGRRAAVLVQQILTFSRKSPRQLQPLDMTLVVKDAVSLIRASLPSTITINTDIEAAKTMILGDAVQIHQVIMNLCINSAQAMQNGGGEITVSMDHTAFDGEDSPPDPGLEPGAYLKLVISDNGQGMAPEIVERIFEPYFTTKNMAVNTGMGLAVVDGIMHTHRGAISVSSQPQRGSTFEVYFPLLKTPAPGAKATSLEGLPRGQEHILFVDDEPQLSILQKMTLERLGYTVTAFSNSAAALDTFKQNPQGFDLVITDLTMPHVSGDRLAKEMKLIRPDLPVILCTGYNDEMSEGMQEQLGADAVLIKPVERAELARTLRRLLG